MFIIFGLIKEIFKEKKPKKRNETLYTLRLTKCELGVANLISRVELEDKIVYNLRV